MNINERLKLEQTCGIDGCDGPALILAEPPRCYAHLDDPDAWFSGVLSETAAPDVPEMARGCATHMAHDLYRNVLLNNPLGQALFSDYKNRVAPSKKVSFSFADVVYFVLIAALSGVIGNFAYDVMKSVVKGLANKHETTNLEDTFDRVVRETKYEELRIQHHPDGSCKIESTSELETETETRYRLVMWKDTDKP